MLIRSPLVSSTARWLNSAVSLAHTGLGSNRIAESTLGVGERSSWHAPLDVIGEGGTGLGAEKQTLGRHDQSWESPAAPAACSRGKVRLSGWATREDRPGWTDKRHPSGLVASEDPPTRSVAVVSPSPAADLDRFGAVIPLFPGVEVIGLVDDTKHGRHRPLRQSRAFIGAVGPDYWPERLRRGWPVRPSQVTRTAPLRTRTSQGVSTIVDSRLGPPRFSPVPGLAR